MRNKMLCVLLFVLVYCTSLWSQAPWQVGPVMIPNPPVIDVTNLISAVENGYTLYNQIQSYYNLIKSNYDHLQQQIKNFESFDINQLDARDPLGSWRAMMTYADRQMSYMQNVEQILNTKNLKIGNASYSLHDLMVNPIGEASSIGAEAFGFVALDPFERQLTTQEKAIFHQKYGISYGHFMRYNYIGEVLQKKAAEITKYSQYVASEIITDRERLDQIMQTNPEMESLVAQQQTYNSVLAIRAQDMKTVTKLQSEIALLYSQMLAQNQTMRSGTATVRNTSNYDFGEEFINMLNALPPDSDFK